VAGDEAEILVEGRGLEPLHAQPREVVEQHCHPGDVRLEVGRPFGTGAIEECAQSSPQLAYARSRQGSPLHERERCDLRFPVLLKPCLAERLELARLRRDTGSLVGDDGRAAEAQGHRCGARGVAEAKRE
jgi:hypothetical protein